MATRAEAEAKVRADLAWRGPSGRPARYVVLEREQAEALIAPRDDPGIVLSLPDDQTKPVE